MMSTENGKIIADSQASLQRIRHRLPIKDHRPTIISSSDNENNQNPEINKNPDPSAATIPTETAHKTALKSNQINGGDIGSPSDPNKQSTEKVLAVLVHRLDSIQPLYIKENQLISRPIIRVHIVDQSTGQPVKSSSFRRISSSGADHVGHVETTEFDVIKNHSPLPVWNEELIIKERFSSLVKTDNLLLFELLDVSSGLSGGGIIKQNRSEAADNNDRRSTNSTNRRPKRVAWAFLKPLSTNITDPKPNTDSMARLQLYEYQKRTKLFGLYGNNNSDAFANEDGPAEAYRSWIGDRKKLKCSLYVTIRGKDLHLDILNGVSVPGGVNLRSRSGKLIRSADALTENDNPNDDERNEVAEIPWRRMMGQKCLIPDKPMFRIESGKSGCSVLSFSSSGFYLAAACINPTSYPLKIFDIVSGNRIVTLTSHQDIIYEICWSEDERLLMTASSDGSVRVWDVFEHSINNPKPVAIFQHPCFVYAAKFHPLSNAYDDGDQETVPATTRLVASGAFDGSIRLWTCDRQAPMTDQPQVIPELTPLQTLEGHHTSSVNALAFSKDGSRMFSGDGMGVIKIWAVDYEGIATKLTAKCIHSIPFDLVENIPINSIQSHITDRKVLITGRNNHVKALDLRLLRFTLDIEVVSGVQKQPLITLTSKVSPRISGQPTARSSTNTGSLRRAIFSPCGNQIYVGTDDGRLAVFSAFTGDLLYQYSQFPSQETTNPITTLSYHPFDYFLAFGGVGQLQPLMVYSADENNPANIATTTAILGANTQIKFQMPPPLSFNNGLSTISSLPTPSPPPPPPPQSTFLNSPLSVTALRSSLPAQYSLSSVNPLSSTTASGNGARDTDDPLARGVSDTDSRRRRRTIQQWPKSAAVDGETMRSLNGGVVAVQGTKEMNI